MRRQLGEDGSLLAGRHRLEQALVAAQPVVLARRRGLAAEVQRHVELQLDQHGLLHLDELPVAAQGDQRQVETPVRLRDPQPVAAARRLGHLVQRGPHTRQVGLAPDRQRRLHDMPFQHISYRVQLAHVAVGERGHAYPAARHVLDQSLLRQQPQGLAQRRPADAQAAGELLLDQPFARLGLATEELPPQPRHRQLHQAETL